jgi:hypothetical protein
MLALTEGIWTALEQVDQRHFQNFGDGNQTRCGDPVVSLLVFLDLLEGYAQPVGKRALAHACLNPMFLDLLADVMIDRLLCVYIQLFSRYRMPIHSGYNPGRIAPSAKVEPASTLVLPIKCESGNGFARNVQKID